MIKSISGGSNRSEETIQTSQKLTQREFNLGLVEKLWTRLHIRQR